MQSITFFCFDTCRGIMTLSRTIPNIISLFVKLFISQCRSTSLKMNLYWVSHCLFCTVSWYHNTQPNDAQHNGMIFDTEHFRSSEFFYCYDVSWHHYPRLNDIQPHGFICNSQQSVLIIARLEFHAECWAAPTFSLTPDIRQFNLWHSE